MNPHCVSTTKTLTFSVASIPFHANLSLFPLLKENKTNFIHLHWIADQLISKHMSIKYGRRSRAKNGNGNTSTNVRFIAIVCNFYASVCSKLSINKDPWLYKCFRWSWARKIAHIRRWCCFQSSCAGMRRPKLQASDESRTATYLTFAFT